MNNTMDSQTSSPANQPRLNRGLLMVCLVVIVLAGLHMHGSAKGAPQNTQPYQEQLRSQVDTDNGAPRDGRNPASQTQTSLAYAASQPAGPGQRVEKPAAAVVGTHKHVDPATVLPDTKKTGVLASGCILGYGTPGSQCIPAGKVDAAKKSSQTLTASKPLNCDPNPTLSLQGIQLSSTDPFNRPASTGKAACNLTQL